MSALESEQKVIACVNDCDACTSSCVHDAKLQHDSKSNDISEVCHCEKGATMVEAALVMPAFIAILLITFYLLLNAHTASSAHFAIQETLRQISVGPTPDLGGLTMECYLKEQILSRLNALTNQNRTSLGSNDKVTTVNGTYDINDCGGYTIVPNDFVTVRMEISYVQDSDFEFISEVTPKIVVQSGTQMADF